MRRRRGAMYVAVLTTTMLVLLLGLSGLTAARIRFATQQNISDAVRAGFLAQASLEHAIQTVTDNATWRNAYTHNAWNGPLSLGDGGMSWKIFDPHNADFSDPCLPVLLIGRGVQGEAVRMLQVEVSPMPRKELLTDGDFEGDLSKTWLSDFFANCGLKQSIGGVSGSYHVLVRNRTSTWAGPAQDVTDHIENGGTYTLRVWAQGYANMSISVGVFVDATGSYGMFSDNDVLVSSGWQMIEVEVTPTWSGDLLEAHFCIFADLNHDNFYVDNASLKQSHGRLQIEHGSFTRILDE